MMSASKGVNLRVRKGSWPGSNDVLTAKAIIEPRTINPYQISLSALKGKTTPVENRSRSADCRSGALLDFDNRQGQQIPASLDLPLATLRDHTLI